MDILSWKRFRTCVNRYHGDTKTHALTTQEFFKIMVFTQLTGRESLRETVLCLNAVSSHLYHLGLPHRLVKSNIAHANHRRCWKVFYDFAMILLAEAKVIYQTTPHDFNFDGCVYALIALLLPGRVKFTHAAGFSKTSGRQFVPKISAQPKHPILTSRYNLAENSLARAVKAKFSLSQTYYEILQILSVTVFEKTPAFAPFAGENYTSSIRGNPNQLTLFDL